MTKDKRTNALGRRLYDTMRMRLWSSYSFLSAPRASPPLFLLGCGRSGKSTLAGYLRRMTPVIYLHEPRDLWISVFPQADIWSPYAASRGGKLVLDASDHDARRGKRLRRLFKREAMLTHKLLIVEELAINSFRLELIKKIFPGARFIHIYRNGLEVAELIRQKADTVGWFGNQNYKWLKLAEYAERCEQTRHLPALCDDSGAKGLLEWRLSTQAIVTFLEDMPNDSYLEFNSRTMIDDPERTLWRVRRFLGLDARLPIPVRHRPSELQTPDPKRLSPKQQRLGGDLLPLSMTTNENLTGHYHRLRRAGRNPETTVGCQADGIDLARSFERKRL